MPLAPDPELARAALTQLDALRDTVTASEDDVLACLVVTGEPRPQRVLDDWLDQVADTLRAIGEAAADLSPAFARYAVAPASADLGSGATGTAEPSRVRSTAAEPGRHGTDTAGPDRAGSPTAEPNRAGSPAPGHGHDGRRS